jgi:DNA mismatch repair protein MutH
LEYTSLEQILKKCEEIKNKKVKDIVSQENILISADKGKLGNLIQKEVFHIEVNNNSAPDFEELGIELKVTGLIKYKKPDNVGRKYKAKERISLGMINYGSILDEPTFEKSHIYFKMKKTLYIFYEYRYDKPMSE